MSDTERQRQQSQQLGEDEIAAAVAAVALASDAPAADLRDSARLERASSLSSDSSGGEKEEAEEKKKEEDTAEEAPAHATDDEAPADAADEEEAEAKQQESAPSLPLEPALTLRVAEIEADAELEQQHEHLELASDAAAAVVIVEAATPSSTEFEPLESPSALAEPVGASDVDVELAAAAALVTVAAAAGVRASRKEAAEANSDDILEKQAASNEAEAAASGAEKTDGAAEEKTAATAAAAVAVAPAKDDEAKDAAASSTVAAAGEKKPTHTNVDDATAKILEPYVVAPGVSRGFAGARELTIAGGVAGANRLEYESALIRDDGEVLVLPKGWSTRASKTHGGKEYYVSPYGHTQWIRPPLRTGIMYKWVHEIEVSFDYGRLGLNLKQITAEPGALFTDLQVHIAEVYKVREEEPDRASDRVDVLCRD